MTILTGICRMAVSLYPKDFREEFGEDIIASFEHHYKSAATKGEGGWSLLSRQCSDVWNLFSGALYARRSGQSTEEKPGEVISSSGKFMVKFRMYFAWQTEDEALFLEDMSRQGWHFFEYTLGFYWFRRLETPKPYRFKFERRLFNTSLDKLQFLEDAENEGWEFFKYWWGWYYFRRPALSQMEGTTVTTECRGELA